MTHEEAQELLGAYALDAVDGDERAALERHVSECVRCASELDGLREVAAALGNQGEPASQELWERISARLYDDVDEARVPPIRALELPHAEHSPSRAPTPVSAPVVTLRAAMSRRARFGAVVTAVAAALLVGVLSVSLINANNHVSQLTNALNLASHNVVDAALETPGHVTVTLNDAHSVNVAKFVLLNGQGYLVSSQMGTLPTDKTYQLWGIIDHKPISIGLMGNSPHEVSFSVEGARLPTTLAVTIEPAGGSVTPTSPIVASGTISA
ncbi:MAG: anti-sigma factor [Acidobacteriota bacterium]|nr:anti-sigma factor [Acidobacteriota bacterium]